MIIKTPCQHCGVNMEWEAEHAGQFVACPSCGQQTRLIMPVEKPAPKPAKLPKDPTNWRSILFRLLLIVAAGSLAYYAFWFDPSVSNPDRPGERLINDGLECDRLAAILFWGFTEIACLAGLVFQKRTTF